MGDKKYLIIILILILALSSYKAFSFGIESTFLIDNDPPIFRRPINLSKAIVNETYFALILADDPDLPEDSLNFSSDLDFINFHTFESTFNPAKGVIDFTPTDDQIGEYYINLTVYDNGNMWDSEVVLLRIVYDNTPPVITDYHPEEENITMDEGDSQEFNVSYYDADDDPISVLWYLDAYLIHQFEDIYTYAPSYDEAGLHNLTVVVTDGIESDEHYWKITVLDADPPPQTEDPDDSGGPSSSSGCQENWVCTPWPDCPEYGIQTRECRDMNNCKTVYNKPPESQACEYIAPPSCQDGVLNQNEIRIDCGGICPPCATCSDGIQNQEETGIDCGGPCPRRCGDVLGMPVFPLCGDGVCQGTDILFCFQDCKSSLLIFLIILAAIVVYFAYSFKNLKTLIIILKERKEALRMLKKRELPGIAAIKKMNYLRDNINDLSLKSIAIQYARAVKIFFSVFFLIKYQFTFEELENELKKSKIKKSTKDEISKIFKKVSFVEYGKYNIKREEFLKIFKTTKQVINELLYAEKIRIKGLVKPPKNPVLRFFFNIKQSFKDLEVAARQTRQHHKKENKILNLIKLTQISIDKKDLTRSKKLYGELSKIYNSLTHRTKKRHYKKMINLFDQIKQIKLKYSKKVLTIEDLENLKSYIKRQLSLKFKDYEIKRDLLSKGWTEDQINEAFNKLKIKE